MISVEVHDEEVSSGLAALHARLTDMTGVYREIGERLLTSTKGRFGQGVSPAGTAWAPKSPTTIEAYKRRGDRIDFRPLFGPSGRLSSEIAYSADQTSVEIGSSLIYAAAMQFGAQKGAFSSTSRGSPVPWGNIPARPFLGLSDSDRSSILQIVADWLDRAV